MRPQATAAFNVGCASPFSQPRIRACLRWTTRADAQHLRAYQSPQLPEEAREAVRQMQIAYPLIEEPSNSKRALAWYRQSNNWLSIAGYRFTVALADQHQNMWARRLMVFQIFSFCAS